jgi:TraY domain
MTEDPAKKPPGRPRKYPVEGKRQNLTFRLGEDTRRRLLDESSRSGRSLSEEIELRVERSFHTPDLINDVVQSTLSSFFGGEHTAKLIQLTAVAIMLVERETGKKWADDYFTKWHAKEAAVQVVSSLFDADRPPNPEEVPELNDPRLTWRPDFGRNLARTLVANQATLQTGTGAPSDL